MKTLAGPILVILLLWAAVLSVFVATGGSRIPELKKVTNCTMHGGLRVCYTTNGNTCTLYFYPITRTMAAAAARGNIIGGTIPCK